ncbi:hypothetical protein [Alistipes sp.]|uniref:hypothetical protein n=1 Tax=Alistipes sp. TaxID=1872444 RepID=UPI003AF032D9
MKNCFKTLMALAALIAATAVCAQEETPADPQKETVIVDPFTYSSGASQVARDNVRSAVMTGFSNVGRFHVVDALTDSRLSKLYENREVEDVVNADNWKSESEAAYKELGAKKLLKGQVELHYEHKKLNDEGKWVYYTDINFTLQVFDITTGTMAGSESYKYSELSLSSYADSFNDAMKKIAKDMTQFCNKHFKMQSYILEMGEADKKGVIKDLWISGGTEMGIANGTIFKVLAEKKVGPKVTRVAIGEVIAKEVLEGMTRCEIKDKKEGEVIKEKFNNQEKLYIELDRKRGDGLKGFGRAFGF